MSLIPAGLMAGLPASLWPDTISIQLLAISATNATETAPAFGDQTTGIAARRIPVSGQSDPNILSVYPEATHKFLTRAYIATIRPGQRLKDQRGLVYEVIIAQSPGEDVFSRVIVKQLP